MNTRIISRLIGVIALIASGATFSQAQVPNDFQSGQPARATEVNENFAALESASDENTTAIATNAAAISNNITGIAANATVTGSNTAAIGSNTSDITANSAAIQSNSDAIAAIVVARGVR